MQFFNLGLCVVNGPEPIFQTGSGLRFFFKYKYLFINLNINILSKLLLILILILQFNHLKSPD